MYFYIEGKKEVKGKRRGGSKKEQKKE